MKPWSQLDCAEYLGGGGGFGGCLWLTATDADGNVYASWCPGCGAGSYDADHPLVPAEYRS